MNRIRLIGMLLLVVVTLQGQTVEKQIRKGNRQYRKGDYAEAEVQYRKALDTKPTSAEAQFNLGDALYQQGNYQSAQEAFQKVLEMTPDVKLKSQAVFNMGNCQLVQERYYDAFQL